MRDTRKLRIFMLENDLTQQKIASTLGISKSYVDDVLKFRSPSNHIREALKREFNFPPQLIDYRPALNTRLKLHRASGGGSNQLNPAREFRKASHA